MFTTAAQYTDEGLKVVLAEDWFIYVVRESDSLMFQYITECWQEWLDVDPVGLGCGENMSVDAMIPFAHRHTPSPVLSDSRKHMTLDMFLKNEF